MLRLQNKTVHHVDSAKHRMDTMMMMVSHLKKTSQKVMMVMMMMMMMDILMGTIKICDLTIATHSCPASIMDIMMGTIKIRDLTIATQLPDGTFTSNISFTGRAWNFETVPHLLKLIWVSHYINRTGILIHLFNNQEILLNKIPQTHTLAMDFFECLHWLQKNLTRGIVSSSKSSTWRGSSFGAKRPCLILWSIAVAAFLLANFFDFPTAEMQQIYRYTATSL